MDEQMKKLDNIMKNRYLLGHVILGFYITENNT
jgi:hypothetical protein